MFIATNFVPVHSNRSDDSSLPSDALPGEWELRTNFSLQGKLWVIKSVDRILGQVHLRLPGAAEEAIDLDKIWVSGKQVAFAVRPHAFSKALHPKLFWMFLGQLLSGGGKISGQIYERQVGMLEREVRELHWSARKIAPPRRSG